MMSRIDCRHWKISTGRHFENGHNTANIQHCPISSKFDMWVDNDVPKLKNFYRSPFSKWPPQYRTNSTLSDFNAISYVGRLWCPKLISDIEKFLPVTIFKMATTIPHKFNIVRFQRHFICGYIKMSRNDSWHRKISTSRHFQNGRHKFNIVWFQRPELIPDIEKFLPVSIFKMAATIPQKFNIVQFQR